MGKLKRIEDGIIQVEKTILVAMIAVMVIFSFLQVAMRTLSNGGFLWTDTFLRHLVLWTGFLGAALAATVDRQFAMDASARLFSGAVKHAIHLLCHAFTAAVSALLASASVSFFREEYAHPAPLFAIFGSNVPMWIFELILPLGFGLLCLHYLIKAAAAAAELACAKS